MNRPAQARVPWHGALCAVVCAALLSVPGRAASDEAPGAGPPRLTTADGQHTLTAQGQRLSLSNAQGQPLREWPVQDLQGHPGQVLALREHGGRRSVIVGLEGLAELWELQLDPAAPPLYEGLVHDWRMGEGVARPGYLGLRRVKLAQPLRALWVDERVPWILLEEDAPQQPVREALVLHLDVRRVLARLPLAGDLAAASVLWRDGVAWLRLDAGPGHREFDSRTWRAAP